MVNKLMKKEKKLKPYFITPHKEGNKLVDTYEEDYQDRNGNKAIITKCNYIDKKGKLIKGYTLRIKWLEEKSEFTKERKQKFIESFHKVEESLYSIYYDGYLSYYFYFENKLHLAYYWDKNFGSEYMIFEISDELIPRKNNEEDFFNHSFVDLLNYLVDNNLIKKYYIYKYKSFTNEEEIIEGNKAIYKFNSQFEKYCKRSIVYK